MFKNLLLISLSLFIVGCGSSASKLIKELIGFKDTKASLDTSNMDNSFSVRVEVNEIITNIANILPSTVIRAGYFIEDEDGKQLFEYKAVLETTINTTCTKNLLEADGISYECNTKYSNSNAYPSYDRNKTIKLFNNKTYYVKLEEVNSLGNKSYKLVGSVKLP